MEPCAATGSEVGGHWGGGGRLMGGRGDTYTTYNKDNFKKRKLCGKALSIEGTDLHTLRL